MNCNTNVVMNLTATADKKLHNEGTSKLGPVDIAQLTCFSLIFLFGGIGNILVLLVIRNKRKNLSMKINDYFILNLALADLLNIFCSIPVDFYQKFQKFSVGSLLCNVLWPLMSTGFFASIFTLTCMAIERHRSICRPLKPRLSQRGVILLLGFVWAAAFVCVLPLVIVAYWDGKTCREGWPNHSMRLGYSLAIVLLQYVVPLMVIAFAYTSISRVLKKSRFMKSKTTVAQHGEKQFKGTPRFLHRSRVNDNDRIIKNLRIIVILFAIFILPKQIVWMWYEFGDGESYSGYRNLLIFSEFFLYIHSMLNPVVYGTILREYRHGFKKYISKACPCLLLISSIKVVPATPEMAEHNKFTQQQGLKLYSC